MPKTVKSLKTTCQDLLSKYLDALTDVGCVPYSLIKSSLVHATPQQLYRIERANPDIVLESDELWLKHCLQFKDFRDEYKQGLHADATQWRQFYLKRVEENEKKKEMIKNKIKSQYNKIQNEKEKRSIKVLHGLVSTKGKRTYESARQSTMSKLFQQTKKETDKIVTIYNSSIKRPTSRPTFIRAPTKSYESNNRLSKRAKTEHQPSNITKRSVSQVNYNLFKELS
ncbi:RNA polymerase II transcription factor SIII subunit A-domain-containing protein [Cokeromyces recurvatus]|uniref:RNA polymerase II transcription factor SIII subunit A-domain-containing protein n=1 Tax=Cokeromyces recurvatus TaxID=90255 RepID=UPI002220FA09|nr:RNA polymerase II transcription factor SIII subunit A-domain-containing protein [Cokeromyces recurvatus]KAI7904552.1 RNA polymerase II transcription factor SIII subunit A-domain-containing protein [Cokeromyces recurvatus]